MSEIGPDEVPNKFLLDEIRLNRAAISKIGTVVSGKVGRTELFGWLGAVTTLVLLTLAFA